jgi:hypothetical protein
MVTKLFACFVAGALLIPAAALGKDGKATQPDASEWKSAGELPLPPVPYLETIPWVSSEAARPGQKVDRLLGPDLNTLKLALDKDSPLTTRYSSMRRGAGPARRVEK